MDGKLYKKCCKKALGVILIILGFLALITPCSPGSWLILVGLEFLGLRFLLEDKMPFLKNYRKGNSNKTKETTTTKVKNTNTERY